MAPPYGSSIPALRKLIVSPNVYDGYSALLVAKMGFKAAATTGAA